MILSFLIGIILKSAFAILSIFPQSTISIGLVGYPQSFLPHKAQSDGEKIVSELVFRKLFKYEEGELKNDLVDSWKTNEEKTEYTIKLKKDQNWQDGTPITTNDVLYSLTLYEDIRNEIEIEKLSDLEILLRLPTATTILPSVLNIGIEPAHLATQSLTSPIGSTSYRIARVIKDKNKVTGVVLLSPLDSKIYKRVFVRFYGNENEVLTAYKLKEINAFFSNADIKQEGLDRLSLYYAGRNFSIIFNTSREKLADPDIRNTLAKSLDTENLFTQNFYVNALRAEGPISLSKYTKESFRVSKYDAKAELSPAQKNSVQSLSIILPDSNDGRQIETFLTKYWNEKLKIKLNFEYFNTSELIKKAQDGSFDVVFIGFEATPDPDRYDFWHSTQTERLNFAKFKDLRADKSLEEGRLNSDFLDRKEHYDIFQDVFETKTPGVVLYHPGTYLYYSKNKPVPLPVKIYYPSDIVKNF